MKIVLSVLQFPGDAFDLNHLPLLSNFSNFDTSLAQFHIELYPIGSMWRVNGSIGPEIR